MFLSDYFLGRVGMLIAGEALTVRAHTAEPGNAGATSPAHNNSGAGVGNELEVTILAANMAADAAANNQVAVDNSNEVVLLQTPNAQAANQTLTHLSYWWGSNFVGWVPLAANYTIVENVPVTIPAGMIDFVSLLGTV